ncbi:MAG: hypothetical protein AAGD25_25345 [Cyanobacteria bacterium P01_F01_bin.150]
MLRPSNQSQIHTYLVFSASDRGDRQLTFEGEYLQADWSASIDGDIRIEPDGIWINAVYVRRTQQDLRIAQIRQLLDLQE